MNDETSSPCVSVVLPTYNERDNIAELLGRLDQAMGRGYEVIVVDDNSPDGTADVVDSVHAKMPHVRVVRRLERGLVGAINRGIEESLGDIIVWMDADLSMPPEAVPELVARVSSGECDAAIGSRFVAGGEAEVGSRDGVAVRCQKIGTRKFNACLTAITGVSFYDWTSGFVAVRSQVIKPITLHGVYGDYFIHLVGRLIEGGCAIVEIPYRCEPRRRGHSKTAASIGGLIGRMSGYVKAAWSVRQVVRKKALRQV